MADWFDDFLKMTAQVLVKSGTPNALGYKVAGFDPVGDAVACIFFPGKSAREFKQEKVTEVSGGLLYMRPWASGELTHNHWINITDEGTFNIIDVKKARDFDASVHHLEVSLEAVTG